VHGVSKTYAMTGWRIGYAAGAPSIIGAINLLQSQSSSCPSTISQHAAVAALTGPRDCVANAVEVYKRRRDVAVDVSRRSPASIASIPAAPSISFRAARHCWAG